jgi:energy-coupling factor transporter ATP-binding protein EcfA2
MFIKQITLRNIRGFSELNFDLTRPDGGYAGWTVFTGDNGSGKSTLLKAVAVGLVGKDTSRSLQPSFNRWIRDGAAQEETSIQLEIVRREEDDELVETGRAPSAVFPAKIALKNGGKETTLHHEIPDSVKSRRPTYHTPDRTIWSVEARGWFSCGYGPFRRVFGASPEATRQMVAPTTERFVTMFQEAASLAEVDQWLRQLKHKELENKDAEREQLALVMELLRDDLMPNQITVDRVDSDGLWLKDRNGVQLAWGEMSDGYRAAAALLADIVRHLIGTYGIEGLTEKTASGKTAIKRSGVVLIDEIDAHLHPAWQREIGFWLRGHFPNLQFLVTTHSPIICQAADPNGLFVLPEPGSGHQPRPLSGDEYKKVIASRPDTILLTPAFGLQNTRSPRAVEARAKLAKLEAKERAGGALTPDEKGMVQNLMPFVNPDEE